MIPKVFHTIWVQGPPPDSYHEWHESWKRLHPTWTHILWSEATYRPLLGELADLHYSTPYGTTGAHYAQQADIAAKAILYELGGVAKCCCFEALRPMDSFFEVDHPVTWWESPGQLGNGIVGVPPKHDASRACVEALPASVLRQRERGQQINNGVGPKFLHKVWANRPDVELRPSGEIYPYYWYESKPDSYGDAYAACHWSATWK